MITRNKIKEIKLSWKAFELVTLNPDNDSLPKCIIRDDIIYMRNMRKTTENMYVYSKLIKFNDTYKVSNIEISLDRNDTYNSQKLLFGFREAKYVAKEC